MKSHIAVAWALGILGGAMFVTGLVRTMRKPEFKSVSRDEEIGEVVANTVFTTEANPTPLTMAGNFVVSTDLVISDAIYIPGKHVITQAEAEEVVKALESHAIVWEVLGDIATNDGRADSAKRCRAREADAKATLAKWRKRVEEGKP